MTLIEMNVNAKGNIKSANQTLLSKEAIIAQYAVDFQGWVS